MRTRRLSTVLAVVAAALAAGCGSSGSADKSQHDKPQSAKPQSEPALTHAEFIKRAEAICTSAAKDAPSFPGKKDKKGGFQTTAGYIIPYLEKLDDIGKRSLGRLQELNPPPAQRARLKRLIKAQQARILNLETAMIAASQGNGAAFTRAFQRDQKVSGPRYVRAATALGLHSCR